MKHLKTPPHKHPLRSTNRPRHLALNACSVCGCETSGMCHCDFDVFDGDCGTMTCDECGHDRKWHRPGKCFGHYDECVCDGYVPW